MNKLLLHRFIFVVIIIIIVSIILGMTKFGIYAFVEYPSHLKSTICPIVSCNVTSGWCYWQMRNYTCYKYRLIYTVNINNENYTKIVDSRYNLFGDYPKICNESTINCYYDDMDIENTLSLYEPTNVNIVAWSMFIVFSVIVIVLLTAALFLLKIKNTEYDEIKDDTEIHINVIN